MAKQEKIIVSAYTGVLMCDVGDLRQYIQDKLGRPVWPYELARKEVQREIEDATEADFIALCHQEDEE